MNITKLRLNKEKLNTVVIGAIKNGFERALIWQDESLDNFDGLPLSYGAQEKTDQTVHIFLSLVCASNKAINQLLEHGASQTGHDLALQMLGHGVGFWEQDSTSALNEILDFLLDMKAIKPFHFYHDESNNKLDWDSL